MHGHSYVVEVFLKANALDNGQMIYDFGLMKNNIKSLIDSFDHTHVFWSKDDPEYIEFCKKFSHRWICLPVSPSAEQLSRIIFLLVSGTLETTKFNNGERDVSVHSVRVHETATGYAEAFEEDVENEKMGSLNPIIFSDAIKEEWGDDLWNKVQVAWQKNRKCFENPVIEKQVED